MTIVKPTLRSAFDFEPAKRLLREWLQAHHYAVAISFKTQDVTYWEYGERPFWSCYIGTYQGESGGYETLGFMIYSDGEIVLVSRE